MDFEDKMSRPPGHMVTSLPSSYAPLKMIVNTLIHMMVGIVVFVVWNTALSFPEGTDIKFRLHILFCVTAYQLFLVEAVLSFTGESWTNSLGKKKKKTIHLCLTIAGALCGVTGVSLAISRKSQHFDSTHSIFGLVTLIFSLLSILNGFATYFDYLLGLNGTRFLVTKCMHTFMGTMSIIFGLCTLMIGINKSDFQKVNDKSIAICMTVFCVLILAYTIIRPLQNMKIYIQNMKTTAL